MLIDEYLLDWIYSGSQYCVADDLGEYLEERDGLLDELEVIWDKKRSKELFPLVPGSGVLVKYQRTETLGEVLVCSIGVRFFLELHRIGSRHICFICRKGV